MGEKSKIKKRRRDYKAHYREAVDRNRPGNFYPWDSFYEQRSSVSFGIGKTVQG